MSIYTVLQAVSILAIYLAFAFLLAKAITLAISAITFELHIRSNKVWYVFLSGNKNEPVMGVTVVIAKTPEEARERFESKLKFLGLLDGDDKAILRVEACIPDQWCRLTDTGKE